MTNQQPPSAYSAALPDHVVVKTITIGRSVAFTFRIWTEQVQTWWPAGHSLSGDPQTQVFIEGGVGGRLYERTSDSTEYDWGEIIVWDPPHHLAHTWRLGSSGGPPSRVDVRFTPLDETCTQVQVEHRGPEFIGDLWFTNKLRYSAAWDRVLLAFSTLSQPK